MGLYNWLNGVPNYLNGVIQRGKRGSGRGKWGSGLGKWEESGNVIPFCKLKISFAIDPKKHKQKKEVVYRPPSYKQKSHPKIPFWAAS